jgi:hypothetical protein
MKQKQVQKDYGKDLFDTVIALLCLLVVLWLLKI